MSLPATTFILLIIIPAGQAQADSGVIYNYSHIFALKGSTVNISCGYSFPSKDVIVTHKLWFIKGRKAKFKNLKSDKEYSGRVQYIYDDPKCTLIIRNLTETDSHVYMFGFKTNKDRFFGKVGVSLTVSDLQVIRSLQCLECGSSSLMSQQKLDWTKNVKMIHGNIYYSAPNDNYFTDDCKCTIEDSGAAVETGTNAFIKICVVKGSTVTISCTCKYSIPAEETHCFIRASDMELSSNSLHSCSCTKEGLNNPDTYKHTLTIRNVRESDSAVYKFVIRTNSGVWRLTGDPGISLTVQDGPRRPSAEVEEDTTVTLSCSADANPAASYSWYKEGESSPKSPEQNFTITHVRAEDGGLYHCHVWNLLGHHKSTVNLTAVPAALLWKHAAIRAAVGFFLIGFTGVFVVLFRKKKPLEMKPNRKEEISSQLEECASIQLSEDQIHRDSKVKASGHLDPKHVEAGEDVEYSDVRFYRASSAQGTTGAVETVESPDSIYSSVKK